MNWLMYISGGMMVFYWCALLINGDKCKTDMEWGVSFLLIFTPLILFWVWFCWKVSKLL